MLKPYLEFLFSKKIDDRIFQIESSDPQVYPLFPQGALCYSIAHHFRQTPANYLYVAPSSEKAEEVYESVSYYLGIDHIDQDDLSVLLLPEMEMNSAAKNKRSEDNDEFTFFYHRLIDQIKSKRPFILVTSANALVQKLPDREQVQSLTLSFGDELDLEQLKYTLVRMGYQRVKTVFEPGEFSIRGGIVDLYPVYRATPVRLSFWDRELESIREYDVHTQNSIRSFDLEEDLVVLPGNLAGSSEKRSNGLIDLFPDACWIVDEPDQVFVQMKEFDQAMRTVLSGMDNDEELDYNHLYYAADYIQYFLVTRPTVFLGGFLSEKQFFPQKVQPVFHEQLGYQNLPESIQNFAGFKDYLKANLGQMSICVLCDHYSQLDRLHKTLKEEDIGTIHLETPGELERMLIKNGRFKGEIVLALGHIHKGFLDPDNQTMIITDREIFGRYKRERILRVIPQRGRIVRDFTELIPGDLVVHLDYGIGIFRGLVQEEVDGVCEEFIELEYADNDRIYVQITELEKLQKYIAPTDSYKPKLTKLGAREWQKQKKKVQEDVGETARFLMNLNAQRMAKVGFAFSKDNHLLKEFENAFRYEETPDQLGSIHEIKKDMESEMPMERLLCGDVGFGKTEVAMRAAFKALQDHKQVAVLAPTTILAQQHFYTFQERFTSFDYVIDVVSGLKSKKHQKESLQKLEEGKTQIIIGTHRLLSKDVKFLDLGLLIVDEEQRFGVRQKEKIKAMKANVDLLYLSATPIPRTLHMAMGGLKGISVIQTPPHNRIPIKSKVCYFDSDEINVAIRRELNRGGQVYYLYNKVETIAVKKKFIQDIVPSARVEYLHAQMANDQIEKIMLRFMMGDFDVLIATTIIENGLDIPNVNSLIIEEAEHFGLSQLYQIRGRIGRRKTQAYALFLIKSQKPTLRARQRLEVIRNLNHLGCGLEIARKDMQIRGVGNLLGKEQHGHIDSVGLETYSRMLKKAIRSYQDQSTVENFEVTVHWSRISMIPSAYIDDDTEKYIFYKRISQVENMEHIRKISEEMIDRYGRLPKEVKNLLLLMQVKLVCKQALIEEFTLEDGILTLQFLQKPSIEILKNKNVELKAYVSGAKRLTDRQICFKLKRSDINAILSILSLMNMSEELQ